MKSDVCIIVIYRINYNLTWNTQCDHIWFSCIVMKNVKLKYHDNVQWMKFKLYKLSPFPVGDSWPKPGVAERGRIRGRFACPAVLNPQPRPNAKTIILKILELYNLFCISVKTTFNVTVKPRMVRIFWQNGLYVYNRERFAYYVPARKAEVTDVM